MAVVTDGTLRTQTPVVRGSRRRRWPMVLVVVVPLTALLLLAGVVWIYSGMIADAMRVPQPAAGFPMVVTSVEGDTVSYVDVPDGWTDQGRYAIRTPDGGYSLTADPVVGVAGAGTRTIVDVVSPPELAVGQYVALDGWYFGDDPAHVLGLPYEQVTYLTPLGPAAAWVIPGDGRTWVVYAHGRGDHPAQGLRLARTAADLGYPMMLIQYRNDPEGPAGTGMAHAGTDEWADLDAAVRYALDRGAQRVVLAGTSMGGAMALALLENSEVADRVAALVLDAPLVDFAATVAEQAASMSIPPPVTTMAKQVAAWRFGFDWAAMDYAGRAAALRVPTLITQGGADRSALLASAEEFASSAPAGTVQLEIFPEAGHTLAWNMEPRRFDRIVAEFLVRRHRPSSPDGG